MRYFFDSDPGKFVEKIISYFYNIIIIVLLYIFYHKIRKLELFKGILKKSFIH